MSIIFFKGFFFALSLIVAIGAQNAFIIKQALLKKYVFIICSICFLSDVFLMGIGIFGVGGFLAKNKIFSIILAVCGIVFTLFYAYFSLKSAFAKHSKVQSQIENPNSLKKIILFTLAFTYLNPQAYLDTIFLIGAAALSFDFEEKIFFAFGTYSASLIWFFSLGYGVKFLALYMKNPKFLRFIDFFTAIIMLVVAYSLFLYLFTFIFP